MVKVANFVPNHGFSILLLRFKIVDLQRNRRSIWVIHSISLVSVQYPLQLLHSSSILRLLHLQTTLMLEYHLCSSFALHQGLLGFHLICRSDLQFVYQALLPACTLNLPVEDRPNASENLSFLGGNLHTIRTAAHIQARRHLVDSQCQSINRGCLFVKTRRRWALQCWLYIRPPTLLQLSLLLERRQAAKRA